MLVQTFREKVSKLKDYSMKVESEANVGYATGFISFDFRNGTIIHAITTDKKPIQYYSVGLTDGSMVMVIGRAGCGKTTWCIQAAGNIIRPYKTSAIFHDDIEGATTHDRKVVLTKMKMLELSDKYIHRNTGITGENFYERIKMIHDIKMENRESYEYDTTLYDEIGRRIYKLEPTIYLLDSLALLMPEKYTSEDDLSGQMSATAAAKMNSGIFKRIVPMLKAANIILLIINHINQKVDINPMAKTKSQVSYLKQGETLPGGNAPIYLSNNILRFDDHSKLKEDESTTGGNFGIDGNLVDVTLVKSRSNKAGQTATLVFDQDNGYDADLSLLVLLKQYKKVNGAGAYLYIGDRDDIKFQQRKFKETLKENAEFRSIVMKEAFEVVKTFIGEKEVEESIDTSLDTNAILTSMAKIAA